MKKLLFLSIFAIQIFAQTPNVYSTLGNEIFSNIEKIENLKTIPEFKNYENKIDRYIQDVKQIKQDGFLVREQENNVSKEMYLNRLRELSSINDIFLKYVENNFKNSIQDKNNKLFLSMVDSGLLDTAEYKNEILDYYLKHSEEMEPSEIIKIFLNEKKEKQKIIQERIESVNTFKKDTDAARIKRIRKRDKEKEEAVIKLLDEEVMKKKKDIRENQKKELSQD
ncbi:MAG: hypothetical protein L3J10_03380 [Sulfurimonas sp.]|nr:hypothetical protein [Sulfurimonas sp.]